MTITTLLAALVFPFVLPVAVSALLWRKLNRRWLFLVTSCFCIVGIDETAFAVLRELVVPNVVDGSPTTQGGGWTAITHFRLVALLMTDIVVGVLGLPLLYWLFSALRSAKK